MPTAAKVERVREIKELLTDSAAALLSDYRGITVKDVTELRQALLEAEASFTVVKNTLTKIAAVEAGLAELESILEGPTAITFVKGDVVLAAKRLADAAKRVPSLEIKGAVMEGKVLSAEQARALATLESREVLLAKMAGMAKASMSRAAYAFNALQSKFLSLLEAYKEKVPPGEAPPEPAAETPTPGEDVPEEVPSPAEDTPEEAPAEVPEETPVQAPEEAPAEVPEELPQESPAEVPAPEEGPAAQEETTEAEASEAPAAEEATAEPAADDAPAASDEKTEGEE
jgi:large subunit ribosomal protein L10